MKVLTYFLLLSVGILASSARHKHRSTQKLSITLYYEALCPFCKDFVVNQLYNSMIAMNRLPYTNLTLVPYGNAKVDRGRLECQHGAKECELNAWHACILENKRITTSVNLITCMMKYTDNMLETCAQQYNIDVGAVRECKASRSVKEILRKYGKETAVVELEGVPAIAVDNVYAAEDSGQWVALFDLKFCAAYQAKFKVHLENCTTTNSYYKYIIA